MPSKGRYLIVGGPGTGKTVVCLLRARRHARNGEDYVFLVWNHLLLRASEAMFDGELEARTWMSWFGSEFKKAVGRDTPKRDPKSGSNWRPFDWQAVRRTIEELPLPENGTRDFPILVIDEGQDMPPGFYDFLNNVGFANIFVAADQNQQIKDENSSRRELEDRLCGKVVELKRNHRNRHGIARLARAFYTGDPASPPPDLPPEAGTAYVPRLYLVNEAAMPRIAGNVLRHWDQDPRRLVGVIAPNNKVREEYLQELKRVRATVSLDNGRPEIETFHRQHRPEVRFDRGGILVINAQACKGLRERSSDLLDLIEDHSVLKEDDRLAAAILFGARDGWLKLPLDLRGGPELRKAVTHRMSALAHRLDASGFDIGKPPERVLPLYELFQAEPWGKREQDAALELARQLKWPCIRSRISLERGRYEMTIERGKMRIEFDGEPPVTTWVEPSDLLVRLAASRIDQKVDVRVRETLGVSKKKRRA